ncbi:MAG: cadherin, partial [Chitinophagaceae bacterium]|nr:cadherin [Chitinophagaceae bacterium]
MKKNYTILLALFFLFIKTIAQPTIGFQPLITGLSVPVDIVAPGDGRLFIVEQNGKIKVWNGTSVLATPFLDASAIATYDVGGERGLLSMAFHPNYAT